MGYEAGINEVFYVNFQHKILNTTIIKILKREDHNSFLVNIVFFFNEEYFSLTGT